MKTLVLKRCISMVFLLLGFGLAMNAHAYYAYVDALTGSYGGSVYANHDVGDNQPGMVSDTMGVSKEAEHCTGPAPAIGAECLKHYVAASGQASLASGSIRLFALGAEWCDPDFMHLWNLSCYGQSGAYGKLFDRYTVLDPNYSEDALLQNVYMGINISGEYGEKYNFDDGWYAEAILRVSYANVSQAVYYQSSADENGITGSTNTTVYVPLPDMLNRSSLDILTAFDVMAVGGGYANFSNSLDIFFMSDDPNMQLSVISEGGYSQLWEDQGEEPPNIPVPEPATVGLFIFGLLFLLKRSWLGDY